ncbi:hypothetical protein GETHLI_32420 [Geothrix limicola]|uniref:Uncharacterized protein n=1 Tax=Geothrix limicola TaxID=2927978 RepID=A0ABQ5QIQ9_9BACT|nr:hypothetical protein [Geothrix limicola]GLH74740.1 hypothetical protein GETHLI_32420 [Geothrix limicola]
MTSASGSAPKKVKEKRQTPEERQAALRYNHMMYGPTAGEFRPAAKKINLGGAYLNHPKFQALMAAFKKGTAYQFDVNDKGRAYTVSTDGTQILFDGRTLYYSRPCNRFEDHLLLDRSVAVQYQNLDALVHLAVAVLRSLSDLGSPQLSFFNHEFIYGDEPLEAGIASQGPNLLIGSFKHQKVQEKPRK